MDYTELQPVRRKKGGVRPFIRIADSTHCLSIIQSLTRREIQVFASYISTTHNGKYKIDKKIDDRVAWKVKISQRQLRRYKARFRQKNLIVKNRKTGDTKFNEYINTDSIVTHSRFIPLHLEDEDGVSVLIKGYDIVSYIESEFKKHSHLKYHNENVDMSMGVPKRTYYNRKIRTQCVKVLYKKSEEYYMISAYLNAEYKDVTTVNEVLSCISAKSDRFSPDIYKEIYKTTKELKEISISRSSQRTLKLKKGNIIKVHFAKMKINMTHSRKQGIHIAFHKGMCFRKVMKDNTWLQIEFTPRMTVGSKSEYDEILRIKKDQREMAEKIADAEKQRTNDFIAQRRKWNAETKKAKKIDVMAMLRAERTRLRKST